MFTMSRLILVLFCVISGALSTPVDPGVVEAQAPVVVEKVPENSAVKETLVAEQPAEPKPVVPEQLDKEPTREQRSYDEENEVNQPYNKVEESLIRKLNSKCAVRDTSSCAMLKLVTYMNRLLKKTNIEVADDVEIRQTQADVEIKADDLPRSFSDDPEESQLAELMMAKLVTFIRSRSLRLHLLPSLDAIVSSKPDTEGNLNLAMALEPVPETQTGRGKNKNMGGIMAALVMKFGMLGALAFKGLVLLVGKALLVSKVALLLAVVLGLKKLFSQQKHVTYEVVAQPHHSHAHVEHSDHGHGGGGGGDSYSSGWGRSFNVIPASKDSAMDLAYRAYVPTQ